MARRPNQGWSEFVAGSKVRPDLVSPIGPAFINCHYVVQVRHVVNHPTFGEFVHLWIRNNDGSTFHDWREFQRIKNELVGEDWTAVEVYPPESEVVDDANIYHLFCFQNEDGKFPFTFEMLKKVAWK